MSMDIRASTYVFRLHCIARTLCIWMWIKKYISVCCIKNLCYYRTRKVFVDEPAPASPHHSPSQTTPKPPPAMKIPRTRNSTVSGKYILGVFVCVCGCMCMCGCLCMCVCLCVYIFIFASTNIYICVWLVSCIDANAMAACKRNAKSSTVAGLKPSTKRMRSKASVCTYIYTHTNTYYTFIYMYTCTYGLY